MEAMLYRVYKREPGEISKELGQCMVTLELVALLHGISLETQADLQLLRFKAAPAEHWRERQNAKKKLGLTSDA